ncbi:MAG: cytochrome c biogenesis protein CcsA [Acidimicrobiales bacterium]
MTDTAVTTPTGSAAAPTGTGSMGTRVIGLAALVGAVFLVLLGLVWSPEDITQRELVRIMYVHVPSATIAYLCCFLTTIGSVMFLWKRSVWWDTVAYAAAEIGAVFMALACVTGAIWARPTWGTFWVWDDARLVTSAMLFLLLVGYLALRKVPGDPDVRAKRSAWLGLLLVPNVILVRQSVEWWRTLHQKATIQPTQLGAEMDGLMLFSLFCGFVVGTLVFAWLVIHRFRVAWLEREADESMLADAIAERRAEAIDSGTGGDPFGPRTGEAFG